MGTKKRWKAALFFGALIEFALVVPLLLVYPHLGEELPAWVGVLKTFQIPGAPLMLRLMRWEWLQQVASRFRVAPEIRFTAQVLSMVIQAAIFTLVALGIVYVWQLRRPRPESAS